MARSTASMFPSLSCWMLFLKSPASVSTERLALKQICEIRYAYNSSGEVTGTSQTLYEYDADNRLTREYDPDHPYTVWKTYTYNESNQLIRMQYSREIGPDDGSVYPFTTEYTYDEHGNLVSETTTIRSRSRINPFVIHTSVRRVDYEYQAFEIPVPPPFEDIEPDGYYRYAVEWAVESGVTKGTSKTTFSPDKTCTRAEAVAFLWRVKGELSQRPQQHGFPMFRQIRGTARRSRGQWKPASPTASRTAASAPMTPAPARRS